MLSSLTDLMINNAGTTMTTPCNPASACQVIAARYEGPPSLLQNLACHLLENLDVLVRGLSG